MDAQLQRFWDPNDRYDGGVIKAYPYWCLEVNFRQHTFGSYVIFCRRRVERISQLTGVEVTELTSVNAEIETALLSHFMFRPDRFNYLQMGNALHHLHIHGIPRYMTERKALDKNWVDSTYGKPPKWNSKDESKEVITAIRSELRQAFEEHGFLSAAKS